MSGCNQTPFIFKYIIFKIMRNRLAIILCLIYAVKTEILHESTNKLLKVKLNSIIKSFRSMGAPMVNLGQSGKLTEMRV